MGVTFTKCGLQDWEELRELSITTFSEAFEKENDPKDFQFYLKEAFSKNQLQKELKDSNIRYFFVKNEREVLGYLKINTFEAQTELQEPQGMELERIYVKSAHQGKGIGLEVLSFIEKLAIKEGKIYLWLGVWEHNQRAYRFYERHGYKKFGTHPYYIGQDRQTDWLLKKEFI